MILLLINLKFNLFVVRLLCERDFIPYDSTSDIRNWRVKNAIYDPILDGNSNANLHYTIGPA